MGDSTVFGLADEMPRWPVFYVALIFFCLTPIPVDAAIRLYETTVREEREQVEQVERAAYQRKLTKGLDKSRFAHLMIKHKGYAFAGEAGHVPQITDKLRSAQKRISATNAIMQIQKKKA